MRKKTSILAIMAIIMMLIIVGCNIDSLILKDPVIQTSEVYGGIAVNILNRSSGDIFYTLDGSTPTKNSILYNDSFIITVEKAIVSAKAISSSGGESNEVKKNIMIQSLDKEIEFSIENGNNGKIVTISPNYGTLAEIYYTTDDSVPNANSIKYSVPFLVQESCNINAVALGKGVISNSFKRLSVVVSKLDSPVIKQKRARDCKQISMTCALGAEIYYTLDGTNPTIDSTKYVSPFPIYNDTELRAIAVGKGVANSNIAIEEISIDRLNKPTITVEITEHGRRVSIASNEDIGNDSIYYTLTSAVPNNSSTPYTGSFEIDKTGETVVKAVCIAEGFEDSLSAEEIVVIEYLVIPTIESEAADGGLRVSIKAMNSDVNIYYSKDGTVPELIPGNLYSSPFIICDESTTIKAVAVKRGSPDSGVCTETYSLATLASPTLSSIKSIVGGKEISLISETEDSKIFYTLDGSAPTLDSYEYAKPFVIQCDTTVKAIATKPGFRSSNVSTSSIQVPKSPTPSVEITKFYGGKEVSITGAAGFIVRYNAIDSVVSEQDAVVSDVLRETDEVSYYIRAKAFREGYSDSDEVRIEMKVSKAPMPSTLSKIIDNSLRLELSSSISGEIEMRYSINSANLSIDSSLYSGAIEVKKGDLVYCYLRALGYIDSDVLVEEIQDASKVELVNITVSDIDDGKLIASIETDCENAIVRYAINSEVNTDSPVFDIEHPILLNNSDIGIYTITLLMQADGFYNGTARRTIEVPKLDAPEIIEQERMENGDVIIGFNNDSGEIYYSLTSSSPSRDDSRVSGSSIQISNSTTVYCRAFGQGKRPSDVNSKHFDVYTVESPEFSDTGAYRGYRIFKLGCSTSGATIMYKVGSNMYSEYSGPFKVSEVATVYAYAKKNGYRDSSIEKEHVTKCSNPTFEVSDTSSSMSVTFMSTGGAKLQINGSETGLSSKTISGICSPSTFNAVAYSNYKIDSNQVSVPVKPACELPSLSMTDDTKTFGMCSFTVTPASGTTVTVYINGNSQGSITKGKSYSTSDKQYTTTVRVIAKRDGYYGDEKTYHFYNNYYIGAIGPSGAGIIFYDKGGYFSDGWRFLEVWVDGVWTGLAYGKKTLFKINANYNEIGMGDENTAILYKKWKTDGFVGQMAYEYVRGDYSDWYLPNVKELQKLGEMLNISNSTKGELSYARKGNYYWSSCEYDADKAYLVCLPDSSYSYVDKNSTYFYGKAIRAIAIRKF